jgi:hypothetical protein
VANVAVGYNNTDVAGCARRIDRRHRRSRNGARSHVDTATR